MRKLALLALLTALPAQSQESIDGNVRTLAGQMTDQYASLVAKSIVQQTEPKTGRVFVTFSIEGFNGGNNVQPYLAVYQPEYKKQDSPPFAAIGEAKFRLIGVAKLCADSQQHYRSDSLQFSEDSIRGQCAEGRGASAIVSEFQVIVSDYTVSLLMGQR